MKKLLVLFSLIIFLPLVVIGPIFAQNFSSGESPVLPRGETVTGDYFATGEKVTISGTVNGDAYVAGGNVLVDGTINGDLLVAGGNVTIRGTVTQDVRAAGGNVVVSSQIGRNTTITGGSVDITDSASLSGSLVAGTGNLQIFAPVAGGMTIGGGNVVIGNTVDGNIAAGVGQLTLTPDAQVRGDVHYWSEAEADIAPGASVSGSIRQDMPPRGSTEAAEGVFSAIGAGLTLASFISALILGLLFIKFVPRFMERISETVRTAPVRSAVIGFIALVVVPILAFFLFITLLLIPLSIVVMVIYFLVMYLSKIFVAYAIGIKAAELLKVTWARGVVYAAGLILFYLISAIPIIGWIFGFVAMLIGFGAILSLKSTFYTTLRDKKLV